ncbi:MAG: helix-turn-helix domain-containing protein [Anaerolineales bacterium]
MRQLYYPSSFYKVARQTPVELTARAGERLRWLRAWRALIDKGLSGQEAAETLHLARSTLYRWEKRLKTEGLRGLEERSRRPKRCRQ